MNIELKILKEEFYKTHELPKYATDGSAGIDLIATEDYVIKPQESVKIPTGIAMHIGSSKCMHNYMGVIVPRSGLGTKGLVLANTLGIIDEDYQGEIIIQAWNRKSLFNQFSIDRKGLFNQVIVDNSTNPVNNFVHDIRYNREGCIEIHRGDRIAQLIIVPIEKALFSVVEEFSSSTERGTGGFGHTGD